MLISNFIQMIRDQKNFSYTKYGDGEIICMSGKYSEGSTNCDYQKYSKDLGKLLIESLIYFNDHPNTYIGTWKPDRWLVELQKILYKFSLDKINWISNKVFLHCKGESLDYKRELYLSIREDPRIKLYVCPRRLQPAADWLGANPINVPESNAFEAYSATLSLLERIIRAKDIILYSAGMMSKPLISELMRRCPTATHLDIGSGLDPIFLGKKTRDNQVEPSILKKLYGI